MGSLPAILDAGDFFDFQVKLPKRIFVPQNRKPR
jgi:hypothetical protein